MIWKTKIYTLLLISLLILFFYKTGKGIESNLISPISEPNTVNNSNLDYLILFSDSFMEKEIRPQKYSIMDWKIVNVLYGILRAYQYTGDITYINYIQKWADKHIDENGNYDREINDVFPGALLLELYEITQNQKYLLAGQKAKDYLDNEAPRLANGTLVHTQEDQLWDDTLFGVVRFLSISYQITGDISTLDEAANQFINHAEILQNDSTGLFYHGWDQDGSALWADPETHLSPEYWARGNGWVIASLIDLLEILPPNHFAENQLLEIFVKLSQGILNTQDESSGLWFTLPLKPELQGNYIEISASSLFLYGLQKSIKLGFLDDSIQEKIDIASASIDTYINQDENNLYYINSISNGTDVGVESYYLQRPVGSSFDHFYGHGVFLEAKFSQLHNYNPLVVTINGNCTYHSSLYPISNVKIQLKSSAPENEDSLLATGQFNFPFIRIYNDYQIIPYKDSMEDLTINTITSFDAVLAARYVVGMSLLSDIQKIAADINKDNEILSFDAAMIARYAVGFPMIEDTFVGEWKFAPSIIDLLNLNQDTLQNNFHGTVLGDIDGSWRPNSLQSRLAPTNKKDVRFESTLDSTVLTFDLSVEDSVLSFDLWISYDTHDFEFLRFQGEPDIPNLNIFINDQPGILKIGAYSLQYLTQHHQIKIIFRKLNLNPTSEIEIDKFCINNKVIISDVNDLNDLHDKQWNIPKNHQMIKNYPNPFNGETKVEYDVIEQGNVELRIFNIKGQIIQSFNEGFKNPGKHSKVINFSSFEKMKFAGGVYFIQLFQNQKILDSIKIVYNP